MTLDLRQSYSEHTLRMLALGIAPLSKRAFLRAACRAYIGLPVRTSNR